MARTITYRVKSPAGPWLRAVVDDTALPQSITADVVGGTTYEVDTGKGTLVDVTPEVSFTLEVFTGTPVAEGSGVFLLEITSPAYLAAYDAGEVEGAGAYRYTIPDDIASGPAILYPGTLNAETYADGDSITPGNPPFGVGSQVPTLTYRVVSNTPSPNTEVFNGATLNFNTTGREGEELSVRAVLTDDNGSTEATIATFTVAAAPVGLTDPTELGAKLLFWLDPTDLTKQWQDTAKTSQVTTTGQTVLRVSDKGGSGGDFGSTTLGPELTISGSDYYWTFADGEEFQRVGSALAQSTTDEMHMNLNITADGAAQAIVAGSAGSEYAAVIQSGNGTSPHTSAGTPAYRVNGADVTSATRGTLYTAINPGTWATLSITNLDMTAGSGWDNMRIFRYNANPTTSAFGLLGDVVITTALTSQERTDLGIWLASRRPA